MLEPLAIRGMPGSASAAAVGPDVRTGADGECDGDGVVLGEGTATAATGARRWGLSSPQPTARTATTETIAAPVMLNRCQRVSWCWVGRLGVDRLWGDGT